MAKAAELFCIAQPGHCPGLDGPGLEAKAESAPSLGSYNASYRSPNGLAHY